MSASSSRLECLPTELIEHTIHFLVNPDDVTNIARASKRLRNAVRSLTWRTIAVNQHTYFQLREWLLWGVKIEVDRCVAMGAQHWPPAHTAEGCVQDDFTRYLRTLVLPERWTTETEAFVKVLAAIGPRQLRALVLGKDAGSGWYTRLQEMWTPGTMDAMLASVTHITFWNASQKGLHFVLNRVPPTVGNAMHSRVKTLEIRKDARTNFWSDPESPGEPDEETLSVSAAALDIDLCPGIMSRIEHLCFPFLSTLTLRTGMTFRGEWQIVQRLLMDSAPSLRVLRLYMWDNGGEADMETLLDGPDTFEGFISCTLPELSRVVVQWTVINQLQGFSDLVGMGQVELVVDKYDANVAGNAEFDLATPVLPQTHWKKIIFLQGTTPIGPGVLHEQELGRDSWQSIPEVEHGGAAEEVR
ncbi:hypothetical protein FB107DRAFT_294936 [Schizophyllum commune]